MHESLFRYIAGHSSMSLTDSDKALLAALFVPKKLRKHQYFLQEGDVCKYIGFVVSGALRQYTVDDKGMEHVVRLSLENWWVGDRESFTMLTPSIYHIDAWEPSELLVITKADTLRLEAIPAVAQTLRTIDAYHAFALQKRINASLSLSAEQRYADLVRTYPAFLQRFPQHVLASYLGITKETLSRIRHKALGK